MTTTPAFPAQPFDVAGYVRLVKTRGVPVTWEKAMFCPSRMQTPNPGDHDPNCDLCDGTGWLYIQPKQTQMMVQGATLEQTFYMQGRFDTGLATITSLPDDDIGYWDRVTLTQSKVRYSELIRRRENTLVDRLRYQTLTVLAVQAGSRVFTPDRDFRLEGDSIVWTSNAAARPKDADFYSILTERRPVYLLLNLLKYHREAYDRSAGQSVRMSQQAQAKLDFLVRDESKEPMPSVTPQSPFSGGTP